VAKRRGCLGCSFPFLIGIVIVLLALFIVGLLAGPVGKALMSKFGVSLAMPDWLNVPQPVVHLPAATVFHIFGLPITNSIVASWLTIVVLVLLCYAATRRMKIVPGRLQAAFEFIVGWIYDLCRNVAGEKYGRRFFPLVATIFLYVAFNAWLSLLPGFGSIELGEHELFRAANTDINTPLALALVSFVYVEVVGLRALGIGYLGKFINVGPFFRSLGTIFKGKVKAGLSGLFLGAISIAVGLLEALSEFIRIISFTFRLFGNMTAGEILLLIAAFLLPWFFAIPFYGLELLVGFVQALIFGGLTLVFLTVAVSHHGSEGA
jgi:F-type H+-transporting ATPase subunit a